VSEIHKCGLLVVRDDGCVLLCRKKRGTRLLILPGGKLEPGETQEQCLRRELREELSAEAGDLRHIGTYTDVAAGDPARTVRIELYCGTLAQEPVASSEIDELVWFGPQDDPGQLAPSLRNRVFPDLIRRGMLSWPSG